MNGTRIATGPQPTDEECLEAFDAAAFAERVDRSPSGRVGQVREQSIVDILRCEGPMSRAAIARRCRISKPTVSAAVRALLATRLVVERGLDTNSKGRPGRLLAYNAEAGFVVGLDVGGTTTRAVMADLEGAEIGRNSEATVQGSVDGLVDQLAGIVYRLTADSGVIGRVVGVGLGTPGVVDAQRRCFTIAPNILALETDRILDRLDGALGVPVTVLNDVNAAAIGELQFGAGVGIRDMVYVGIGTGLGFGLVIDGSLHQGVAGRAGEMGLLSYHPGSNATLESVLSGEGLRRRHAEAGGSGRPEDAFTEAERDLEPGATVVSGFLQDVVWVISVLNTMLDPERIILGGGIGLRCGAYLPRIRQTLEDRLGFATEVIVGELGDNAGLKGAVVAALEPARRVERWLGSSTVVQTA